MIISLMSKLNCQRPLYLSLTRISKIAEKSNQNITNQNPQHQTFMRSKLQNLSLKLQQNQSKCSNLTFALLFPKSRFSFCRQKNYVDQYKNLKTEIEQKRQKVKKLKQKLDMLQKMSQMSLTDHLLKPFFSLLGKTYETKAFKQHRQVLIDLRNQLEKKIEDSSEKWEEPRKLILDERQKKVRQFITNLIEYEGSMAQFLQSRQKNKLAHLADVNEGLVLNHKLLVKNIQKEGASLIQPCQGAPFDPKFHQIQNQSEKNSKNRNLIINISTMYGWKFKDSVVRKAKVIVK